VNGTTTKLSALRTLIIGSQLALILGCGSPYDASVSGIATLENAPLTTGTVKFTPEQSGPSGYGSIGTDGSYSIMIGREEGLPSGSYVVTVVANEESIPNKNPSLPPAPGKPITPLWYRDPATSPLKVTVEAGSNDVPLNLTAVPPPGWKPPRRR
jgi:hypothetical protein